MADETLNTNQCTVSFREVPIHTENQTRALDQGQQDSEGQVPAWLSCLIPFILSFTHSAVSSFPTQTLHSLAPSSEMPWLQNFSEVLPSHPPGDRSVQAPFPELAFAPAPASLALHGIFRISSQCNRHLKLSLYFLVCLFAFCLYPANLLSFAPSRPPVPDTDFDFDKYLLYKWTNKYFSRGCKN